TPNDKGIYGMMTQLTVTGPYVNKTLFEQAKVPLPGPNATWDDWAAATRQVAKATQVPFAMAFDRSGHRFTGAAISQGAKYFDAKGNLVVDDGYKAMAKKLYDWNRDGTMPKEVWGGVGGATYRDAFEEFANGRVVMYLSGSWQIRRMATQIGKNFDWTEVPKLSPVAYEIQGYKLNRAIFNPTAARLGQAIAGEMSLDDALKRIGADIDEQVKAAAK